MHQKSKGNKAISKSLANGRKASSFTVKGNIFLHYFLTFRPLKFRRRLTVTTLGGFERLSQMVSLQPEHFREKWKAMPRKMVQ